MKPLLIVAMVLGSATPPVQIVARGSGDTRAVALTFDAGADRGYAATILHTLERNRIRATFGMTGLWAQSNPDLLRRMVHDGDQIVNHTYDHRSFTGYSSRTPPLGAAQRAWEVRQTEQTVWRIAHVNTRPFFRPPFGDYDGATLSELRRLGYRYMVMWTVDSLGWDHLPSASILSRCLAAARSGTIYLMHVGSQSQDAQALEPLVVRLHKAHYRFLTVKQMLAH